MVATASCGRRSARATRAQNPACNPISGGPHVDDAEEARAHGGHGLLQQAQLPRRAQPLQQPQHRHWRDEYARKHLRTRRQLSPSRTCTLPYPRLARGPAGSPGAGSRPC